MCKVQPKTLDRRNGRKRESLRGKLEKEAEAVCEARTESLDSPVGHRQPLWFLPETS